MPSSDRAHQPVPAGTDDGPARGKRPVVQLLDGLVPGDRELRGALDLALERGPRALVVDMSSVDHVTSTTITALLTVQERCSARGVQVLLRCPNRRSLDTLRRVGLMRRLRVEEATSRPAAVVSGADRRRTAP